MEYTLAEIRNGTGFPEDARFVLVKPAKKREPKRAMRVRMTYTPTGEVYYWTVRKARGGWDFEDHEGCLRYAYGSWADLVAKFKMVADNYAMSCNIS